MMTNLFQTYLRVMLAVLLSTLVAVTFARAHEVQPGVMDIEFQDDRLHIYLDWMLEAPVAGVDLSEGLLVALIQRRLLRAVDHDMGAQLCHRNRGRPTEAA